MHQTTMKTKGRQLQRACKTRWLLSELTVRARCEILAIWAALKQMSEIQNDGNARCFTAVCENKKFQHGTFFLSTLAPHLTELGKVFQAGCFNLAQMKAEANPASKVKGAISVTFGSQVSLRVHYCKRDEVYFTTLLWQNNGSQNGLIIESDVFRIVQNHGE